MTRAWKIAALLVLYFVQGMPYGFQATALPAYLRASGVSLEGVGFASMLALPWLFKVLWAPAVDSNWSRRLGRRRSWILPLQALLGSTCAAAALVPPDRGLAILLALIFAMNLFAATQDIAVDGLAVDWLAERELGLGNAVQVVGYKLGILVGGGLLVWASGWIGWSGLFGAMSALTGLGLIVALAIREPPPDQGEAAEGAVDVIRSLWAAVRAPGTGWLLVFIATYKLGETMVDAMFKPFLIDAGYTVQTIGLWVGTWGLTAGILGSLAGGLLASRIRLIWAVGVAATLRIFPMVGEWWLTLDVFEDRHVIAVTCAEGFFGGALTTCMFALMMSRVDRRIGATHYTALACVEVLGKLPAAALSGVVAGAAGYSGLFAAGVGLSVLFLGLLPLVAEEGRGTRSLR